MGLDITAFTKLTRVVSPSGNTTSWSAHIIKWVEDNFPGRTAGIEANVPYAVSIEPLHFRAGSYGGYGAWRNDLARLAGYPASYEPEYEHKFSAGAWAAAEGPFWELINFADNEGVIGPVVSAKLLKDFEAFDARAKGFKPDAIGYFYDRYQHWHRAFKLAADGGAVDFG